MPRPTISAGAMKEKPDKATAKRLLRYIFHAGYTGSFVLVVLCIVITVISSVASSLFIQTLIDQYIVPLMGMEHPVFTGLLKALGFMAIIFVAGIITSLISNRVMVNISQGVLKNIRDDLFAHMQTLPIRYFDTHTHGDIMSYYTNDTDTLRQFIS